MDPADRTQAEPVWQSRLRLIVLTAVFSILFASILLGGLWFAASVALGNLDRSLHVSRTEGVIIGLFIAGMGGLFLWKLIAAFREGLGTDASKPRLLIRSKEDDEGVAGAWVLTLLLMTLIGWADYHFLTSPFHTKLWVVASHWVASLALVAMLGWVIWRTIQLGKFGVAELRLAAPVKPGGALSATMIVPPAARAPQAVFAELVATRMKLLAVAPDERWDITEERSQKRNFPTRTDGGRCVVDFHFEMPPDSPPTTMPANERVRTDRLGEYVSWELRVTAVLEGVDLVRTFDIQVIAGSLANS